MARSSLRYVLPFALAGVAEKELLLARAIDAYIRRTTATRKDTIRGRFAAVIADPEVQLVAALKALSPLLAQALLQVEVSDCLGEIAELPAPPHPELP